MRAELSANRPLRRLAAAALAAFRSAVFPARCLECRRLLPAWTGGADTDPAESVSGLLQPYFCPDCRAAVMPLEHPLCPRCGVMFKGRSGEDHLCSRCLEQPPPFHMARAAFAYDRSLVDVIHCFKYKGKTQLAGPLGILLWRTFLRYWGDGTVDLILPVPLHGRRLRQRGFNQADLLVRGWKTLARHSALPPVASAVLRRTRTTRPQAGLGRRERESNIREAFRVRHPERVRGRHVLLIDDVVTTGATVGECARQLLASGAGRVDVLALARVI
jgi:ComF family protein